MATNTKRLEASIISELSKSTGVDEGDVARVLRGLGLSAVAKQHAQFSKAAKVSVAAGQVTLAIRATHAALVV